MKFAITALVVALVAVSASASTYIWNGSVSNVWSVVANWTPTDGGTTFPQGAGQTAIFTSSAAVSSSGLTALPSINVTGVLDITIPSGTLQSPNGTTIDGTGSLILRGATKFNQGGAPNTLSGGIDLRSGKASISGGDTIIPAGGLTLSGGTMQMLSGDRIADTCQLIFNSAGAGMINWGGNNETMGTVKLLNKGAMNALAGVIHFADSSAVDWSAGTSLRVEYLASAGLGAIYFGSSSGGLTAAQLAKITLAEMDDSYNDTGNYYLAGLDETGKLVIAPEPMTLSLLLVGGIAGLIRRR